MLAENSTLKAALDTYQSELQTTSTAGRQDLVTTIARELDKLADAHPAGRARDPRPVGRGARRCRDGAPASGRRMPE